MRIVRSLIKKSKTTTLKARCMPKRRLARRSPSRPSTTTPTRKSTSTRPVTCLVLPATKTLQSKSPSSKR